MACLLPAERERGIGGKSDGERQRVVVINTKIIGSMVQISKSQYHDQISICDIIADLNVLNIVALILNGASKLHRKDREIYYTETGKTWVSLHRIH